MLSFTLDQSQKNAVIAQTQHYINLANQQLQLNLSDIPILFNLKGCSSGMFVVKKNNIYIRYNEIIFSQYFKDNLDNTVAHEVAHYVVYGLSGPKKVKPHGIEWKRVMKLFNIKAEVTSSYDISDLPLQRQKQHHYTCGCMSHQLSTTRHNKIQKNTAVYKCRQCRQALRWNCVG